MDESHFKEIDAALMYIEEARARVERAARDLRRDGADEHLLGALDQARERLSDTQRRLLQQTHFAAPSVQATL